ncbi:GlcG/HbpS family heme-binding protein [Stygiolobus caldivivus]|uniref:ATP--cob(I)alamin adenosyltransferase n=1 Tax=Stygiolobus caldivivus TaxID=2824673 RepID=A0A8D5ZJH0_9CREN|nr:heme-binding protein [Stygiolobus caldivivus]BCU71579.1 ATP--cob(I)alamin adenosyltransferase [Stygiolobus caldivivus]
MIIEKKGISLELAERMIDAAEKKAKDMGVPVVIAVVDEGGSLKALRRMDGAPLLSVDIAINKAWTAVAFGIPTHEWYEMIKNDPPLLHGIVHTPRLIIFGGGYPIHYNGQLIGGIGVSGGTSQQDMECAKAGLEVVKKLEGSN